jgi:hypothetical protein
MIAVLVAWTLFITAIFVGRALYTSGMLKTPRSIAPISTLSYILIGIVAVIYVCQITGQVSTHIGRRKHLKQLRKAKFSLCPGCRYDLSATPRIERCPECARHFGPGGCVREWGRIMPRRIRSFYRGGPLWKLSSYEPRRTPRKYTPRS